MNARVPLGELSLNWKSNPGVNRNGAIKKPPAMYSSTGSSSGSAQQVLQHQQQQQGYVRPQQGNNSRSSSPVFGTPGLTPAAIAAAQKRNSRHSSPVTFVSSRGPSPSTRGPSPMSLASHSSATPGVSGVSPGPFAPLQQGMRDLSPVAGRPLPMIGQQHHLLQQHMPARSASPLMQFQPLSHASQRSNSPTPGTMLLHGVRSGASPQPQQPPPPQQQAQWPQRQSVLRTSNVPVERVPIYTDGVRLFAAVGRPAPAGHAFVDQSQNHQPGYQQSQHHHQPTSPRPCSQPPLAGPHPTSMSRGPSSRHMYGSSGKYISQEDEAFEYQEEAIVYEATDQGITSFRKLVNRTPSPASINTAPGVHAGAVHAGAVHAGAVRGPVGMHIVHDTRTEDDGSVVNVHKVDAVMLGSAADIAGVQVGDEVVELVGVYTPHLSPPTLRAIFAALPTEGSLRLVLHRPSKPKGTYPPSQSLTVFLFDEEEPVTASMAPSLYTSGGGGGLYASRGHVGIFAARPDTLGPDGELYASANRGGGGGITPIGGERAPWMPSQLSHRGQPPTTHRLASSRVAETLYQRDVHSRVETSVPPSPTPTIGQQQAIQEPRNAEEAADFVRQTVQLALLSAPRLPSPAPTRLPSPAPQQSLSQQPQQAVRGRGLVSQGTSGATRNSSRGRQAVRSESPWAKAARSESPFNVNSDAPPSVAPHWGQGLPDYTRGRPLQQAEASHSSAWGNVGTMWDDGGHGAQELVNEGSDADIVFSDYDIEHRPTIQV